VIHKHSLRDSQIIMILKSKRGRHSGGGEREFGTTTIVVYSHRTQDRTVPPLTSDVAIRGGLAHLRKASILLILLMGTMKEMPLLNSVGHEPPTYVQFCGNPISEVLRP
jgi:hypothetical protein